MLIPVSVCDSELLAEMHGNCFDDSWNAESFRSMLSQKFFFGFIYKKEYPQGFLLGKMICDEIEIVTFCVLPKFRNLGVGKALLHEVDTYALVYSAHQIFLEVSEDNAIAKKTYEDFDYKVISRRAGYYKTKDRSEDAIVMRKSCQLFC
jgi:ribosomal-protein-alanine N-acetyltransferase